MTGWNLHVLVPVAALALAQPAFSAGTPASTVILNQASVTFQSDGNDGSANSNTTRLIVDERLDAVAVSDDAAGVTVTTPDNDRVLRFTVTNTGNGSEAFGLSVNGAIAGDQYDPTDLRLFLDSNGNGALDAGTDPAYVAGSNDPALDADESLTVFATGDTEANRQTGDSALVELTAAALTGSGAPGTSFPGLGDGGTTAVVGASGASAAAEGRYRVAGADTALVKSQSVRDPNGGSNPVVGAVITYTLTFTVEGGGIANALITDPIPANTTYIGGSLRLNGAPLTDAADGDAGRFTGSGIEANLGDVAAPAIHTIQFSVLIN